MDILSSANETEQQIRKILNQRGLAVLATIMGGSPHQGLIAIAVTDDLKNIIFTTPTYTRKFENIKKNPGVSLLIDDRGNTELDFLHCTAVTARGEASIEDKKKDTTSRSLYLSRHPYLEKFLQSPSSAIIRVRISTYTLVTSFQQVREWSPGE